MQVPQRVAIAVFNDLTGSDQLLPALTTVRTPRAEIGRMAGQLLVRLIQGADDPARLVDPGFELVVRQST